MPPTSRAPHLHKTDRTLIIGGGLSGLALADMLHSDDTDFTLLEARARFGGRIHTLTHHNASYDMGPAWFWPAQPRMAAMVARFGLGRFDQYAQGDLTFEDETQQVQRGRGFSSMEGSWRIDGGFTALTHAIVDHLPQDRLRLNATVTALDQTATGVTVHLQNGETLAATRAVLAMPPRICATLAFAPALPPAAITAMTTVPTWMAGQAKALALYPTPFWREAGLSGDAMSGAGPMVEIHDASPKDGGPYGLFGFIGVPPQGRRDPARLRHHLLAQLTRLFGPKAATPLDLHVTDWADDPHTATPADHAPLYAHPSYGLPREMAGLWNNRLVFAGTEVAPKFGGYLEGALEAAERAAAALRR